jgi:hypothetical protein
LALFIAGLGENCDYDFRKIIALSAVRKLGRIIISTYIFFFVIP